jgi:predicted transcriptional regulator
MSLIKQYLHANMNDLQMLTAREQLMEDIDAIVEEHSYYSNMSSEKAEDLIRVLCDAVCKNFPTK